MNNTDKKIGLTLGAIDSVNMGATFALFLKETLYQFFQQTGRYFMFPFFALTAIIGAILAWRESARAGDKPSTVLNAAVETASAIAITVTVVGSFVAGAIFASIAPLIFAGSIIAKTLYNFGSAIYYGIHAAVATDSEKKTEYSTRAKTHLIVGVAGLLAGAAVVGVMIFAKPLMAVFGIVAGVMGTLFAIKTGVDMYQKSHQKSQSPVQVQEKQPLVVKKSNEKKAQNLLTERLSPASDSDIKFNGGTPSRIGFFRNNDSQRVAQSIKYQKAAPSRSPQRNSI